MSKEKQYHTLVSVVLTVTLVLAIPLSALASPRSQAQSATLAAPPTAATATFVFGKEGDNLNPLAVTIYGDGTVRATGGLRPRTWMPRGRLSPDALDGLMTLARAEGFFNLPRSISGPGPGNSRGRFISIRTTTGTTRVAVRLVRRAGFDQLYAVLMAAAGVTP